MDLDDPEFRTLVDEGRYASALELLEAARAAQPHNGSIVRSIQHLRARLGRQCIEELGSLDGVPHRTDQPGIGADQQTLLHFVDGIASYDDILESSMLSRMTTLVLLVDMERAGVLSLETAKLETPKTPGGDQETPDTRFEGLVDEAMMALIRRDYPRALSLLIDARATGQSHPLLDANFTRLAELGFNADTDPMINEDDEQ